MASLIQATSLEGEPQVIVYVYIDSDFAYKSRVYPRSPNPVINLDIDMYFSNYLNSTVNYLRDRRKSSLTSMMPKTVSKEIAMNLI